MKTLAIFNFDGPCTPRLGTCILRSDVHSDKRHMHVEKVCAFSFGKGTCTLRRQSIQRSHASFSAKCTCILRWHTFWKDMYLSLHHSEMAHALRRHAPHSKVGLFSVLHTKDMHKVRIFLCIDQKRPHARYASFFALLRQGTRRVCTFSCAAE